MRKSTFFISSILQIILIMAGCKNNPNERIAGGPCTYETHVYPLKVIKVEQKDSLKFDLIFERNREGIIDTLSYYLIRQRWLRKEDLIKDGIENGKVFKWKEETILSGDCTPKLESLILEKY